MRPSFELLLASLSILSFAALASACGGTSTAPPYDAGGDARGGDAGAPEGGSSPEGGGGRPSGGGMPGGGGAPVCAPGRLCGGLTSCTDECFGPDCCYLSCDCWSVDDTLHCSMTCGK